jgi:hypothetical protein
MAKTVAKIAISKDQCRRSPEYLDVIDWRKLQQDAFGMKEDFDEGIQVEALAAALKMGKAESRELLETLATRLQVIMPETTSVERGGFILSSNRPVRQLTVRFDDCHLQLVKEKTGTLNAKTMKVVRGVVLKTTSTTVDEWIKTLAAELTKAAQSNAQTRDALNKFVIG